MPRGASSFKQSTVTNKVKDAHKAAKGVSAAGLSAGRCVVHPDGTIEVFFGVRSANNDQQINETPDDLRRKL